MSSEVPLEKPAPVYRWENGVRVEVVSDLVLVDSIKILEEAEVDTVGLGELMEVVRRRSRLEG